VIEGIRRMGAHAGLAFLDGLPKSEMPHAALRSASGLVIAWDGRLDNRDDLKRQLGNAFAGESDAAIALALFERDGADGLHALVGDWSLVVWDSLLRTVYLARDYMGVRPLYYCHNKRTVYWSSSLGELAIRTGRVDELDDEFAAGFMAAHLSTDVTPYRGIRAVPCGCVVQVRETGEARHHFWSVQPATIRYRDRRTYEEHLRALWKESIAVRLCQGAPAWAELSGGFDSSSIVCMADALVKEGSVAATAVRPISHVTFESAEGDERAFINEVEAWTGLTSTILGVEQHQDLRADDDWVTPLAARGVQVASERLVSENGGGVILSGRMGDLVMGCSTDNSAAVFDDFGAGNVGAALSNMRLWSRACRKPFVELGWNLARDACYAASRRIWRGTNDERGGVSLLAPGLQRFVHAAFTAERFPRVRLSTRRLAAALLSYSGEARLEDRSSDPRVTYSYPFAHRPLVEYMLAIPAEELSAPGAPRSLMRRAFTGIVPDRILRRQSKGCYPPAAMRAVRRALASLPHASELQIVRRGWLDASRLADAVHGILHGGGQSEGGAVQRALILEDWLARRERRGPAAFQQREEVRHHGVCNA
jgi:asparagine synthase (glutamine-hydrolysing)